MQDHGRSQDARHYPRVLSICLMEYFSVGVTSLLGSDEATLIRPSLFLPSVCRKSTTSGKEIKGGISEAGQLPLGFTSMWFYRTLPPALETWSKKEKTLLSLQTLHFNYYQIITTPNTVWALVALQKYGALNRDKADEAWYVPSDVGVDQGSD